MEYNKHEVEESIAERIEDSFRKYLGLDEDDMASPDEELTWKEHEEAVKKAENTSVPDKASAVIDNECTLLSMLESVVTDTLHSLDAGIITFESGEEMLATVQAVAALDQMKAGLHVK